MAKTQYGFYFDQTRCMACNACTIACKDWNQVNPGPVAWRRQFTYERNGQFFPFAMGCNHCEEPACLKACGYQAITKDSNGIVTVDRSKCRQAKSCITACPFAKPQIADDKQEDKTLSTWQIDHPMQKCTMCKDRLDTGEQPICVRSCGARALDFGDMEELRRKYPDAVQVNPTDFPYLYLNNNTDTKPSILVKKRTEETTIITKPSSAYQV